MSGNVSNGSVRSSGSSSSRTRSGRVVGVPKRCWCGEPIVALISKSENNPYRRYYRCVYAVSNKLVNDNHIFKWVDEAMLNKIEELKIINTRMEEQMRGITELENLLFEKVQMKLEKETLERIEDGLLEAKYGMKKMMVLFVIGCMIFVGLTKLV